MENRNGLIVDTELTRADGYAERAAALTMIERHAPGSTRRLTLGADKGYDTSDFVDDLRAMCVTPHVAAKAKGSAIDGRTTRHAGAADLLRRSATSKWAMYGLLQSYRGVSLVGEDILQLAVRDL